MRKQMIGKARIHRFENGKFRVIFKGQEITLQELRNKITELILEELKENKKAWPAL